MTTEEETRLWRVELLASRRRYAAWLEHERLRAGDSPAVARAKELICQAQEIVAEARALRSRNR